MKSRTTPDFWECFGALPQDVQRTATRAFANWRAIGRMDGDTVTWFWIGSHADYDRLVG